MAKRKRKPKYTYPPNYWKDTLTGLSYMLMGRGTEQSKDFAYKQLQALGKQLDELKFTLNK